MTRNKYLTSAAIAPYTAAHPAPGTEGRLISVFRRGAGSGGRWGALEMRRHNPCRRSKPLRPGAPAARHWAPLTAAAGTVRSAGHRLGPKAVDRRPSHSKGKVGCLKGKSTGGGAEQAYKHRARDAGEPAPRGDFACASKLTTCTGLRGTQSRLRNPRRLDCAGAPAFRAPSFFGGGDVISAEARSGRRRKEFLKSGYRASPASGRRPPRRKEQGWRSVG